MFKLHSPYKPTGDQPQAIEYLSKGQKISNITWSYRLRKNLHNGKHNKQSSKTNLSIST